MRAFWIFLVGSLIVAGGVSYALYRIGIDPTWIIIVAVVIVGLAVVGGASLARKTTPAQVNVNSDNSGGSD